jgi:hypothetical protein
MLYFTLLYFLPYCTLPTPQTEPGHVPTVPDLSTQASATKPRCRIVTSGCFRALTSYPTIVTSGCFRLASKLPALESTTYNRDRDTISPRHTAGTGTPFISIVILLCHSSLPLVLLCLAPVCSTYMVCTGCTSIGCTNLPNRVLY